MKEIKQGKGMESDGVEEGNIGVNIWAETWIFKRASHAKAWGQRIPGRGTVGKELGMV